MIEQALSKVVTRRPLAHAVAGLLLLTFVALGVTSLLEKCATSDEVVHLLAEGGVAWDIGREGELVRIALDTGERTVHRLLGSGLPLRGIDGAPHPSPDGRHAWARYLVDEDLTATAIWELATGVVVWVGSDRATIAWPTIADEGGITSLELDVDRIISETGRRTNLRVCPDDYRAVAVEPPPAPEAGQKRTLAAASSRIDRCVRGAPSWVR